MASGLRDRRLGARDRWQQEVLELKIEATSSMDAREHSNGERAPPQGYIQDWPLSLRLKSMGLFKE